FRRVPEGGVENYSFLNFFLTDSDSARKAQKALSESGMDGVFYWYDNNWHYHRRWEHLKGLKSVAKLPLQLREQFTGRNTWGHPKSDHWMGRTLSVLIKLNWDQAELQRRAGVLRDVLTSLQGQ
ncbi:MAG: L-glutamine--2-deoxy-scyllo-inosose aminotransferase KanB, partial [Robiginitalea sp.]